jgi:hypothetical protein
MPEFEPAPLMCYFCVTRSCQHRHPPGQGYIPAVTLITGTALCRDCAVWDRSRNIPLG